MRVKDDIVTPPIQLIYTQRTIVLLSVLASLGRTGDTRARLYLLSPQALWGGRGEVLLQYRDRRGECSANRIMGSGAGGR